MAELPLFSKDGKSTGTVSVDEKLFGDKVRKRLLHQVVVIHEANQREGNAHTKTRGEVEGSTKKMWPQKHTGILLVVLHGSSRTENEGGNQGDAREQSQSAPRQAAPIAPP